MELAEQITLLDHIVFRSIPYESVLSHTASLRARCFYPPISFWKHLKQLHYILDYLHYSVIKSFDNGLLLVLMW